MDCEGVCRGPRRGTRNNDAPSEGQFVGCNASVARDRVEAVSGNSPAVCKAQTLQPVGEILAPRGKWGVSEQDCSG